MPGSELGSEGLKQGSGTANVLCVDALLRGLLIDCICGFPRATVECTKSWLS